MKYFLSLMVAMTLVGCGTLDGKLENALAPALACDKTFIVSQYGPWGITSQVRPEDHTQIALAFCKK